MRTVCLALAITLLTVGVLSSSLPCNPTVDGTFDRSAAAVLAFSQGKTTTTKKPTTTTTTKAATTTAKPTTTTTKAATTTTTTASPTTLDDDCGGVVGTCCYDCRTPYHVATGANVQLCTCTGVADPYVRLMTYPCYPSQTINASSNAYFGAYQVNYAINFCAAKGCSCIDASKVAIQPIYLYTGAPPVGDIVSATDIARYNYVVGTINNATSNGTISKTAQTALLAVSSAVFNFYTLNGIGDITATNGQEFYMLNTILFPALKAGDDAMWTDPNLTMSVWSIYNFALNWAASESYRFIDVFKAMVTAQNAALVAINPTLPSTLLAQVSTFTTSLQSIF